MERIYLSQPIDNADGYIDSIIAKIHAIEKRQPLVMEITCVGGDVFQGARLQRAILEHRGKTKAIVIGLAASMAGVLLAVFDEVEIDDKADIMLHKAWIPDTEEYTPEQLDMVARFDARAYESMLSKGVSEELLSMVYAEENQRDIWLTAKEAESFGIGYVTKVERKNSKPYIKMAALLGAKEDKQNIYNNYKQEQMGLYGKKPKAIMHEKILHNGDKVVFSAFTNEIKKGTVLALIGSDKSISGRLRITDKLVAVVDEENKVVSMEEDEAPVSEITPEQFAEVISRVSSLEETVKMLAEKMQPTEEMVAALNEEAEDSKEKVSAIVALLEKAGKAQTDFRSPKAEDKNEKVIVRPMTETERVQAMFKASKASTAK